jgi:hypothetical protein
MNRSSIRVPVFFVPRPLGRRSARKHVDDASWCVCAGVSNSESPVPCSALAFSEKSASESLSLAFTSFFPLPSPDQPAPNPPPSQAGHGSRTLDDQPCPAGRPFSRPSCWCCSSPGPRPPTTAPRYVGVPPPLLRQLGSPSNAAHVMAARRRRRERGGGTWCRWPPRRSSAPRRWA